MKGKWLLSLFVATFICVLLIQVPHAQAQLVGPRLQTNLPVYPIWKIGGAVNVNASRLLSNITYNLWLQRPTDSAARVVGDPFNGGIGNFTVVPVTILPSDPAGTYSLSLSSSRTTDTREAVIHFGVFGVDKPTYSRTDRAAIAGGGFAPTSTITISFGGPTGSAAGFPATVTSGSNGDFQYSFRVPPSTPVGNLTLTVSGRSFDTSGSASASSSIAITRTSVRIGIASEPSETVERTATASATYTLTYPDGSPVTTASTNTAEVSVTRTTDGVIISTVPLVLSDSARGTWIASWIPRFDANLTFYHFALDPATFDDSYGNLGSGNPIPSNEFSLVTARTDVAFRLESPIQRSQVLNVTLLVTYHDGTRFQNVTQIRATITSPAGSSVDLFPVYNSTLGAFQAQARVPANGAIGTWRLTASVADSFGNAATGSEGVNVINAVLAIGGAIPSSVERTMPIPVAVHVTYPDGTIVNATSIPLGFNATITFGNNTITVPMLYNPIDQNWLGIYPIAANATLGEYSISLTVEDAFGNEGGFSTTTNVVLAHFRFSFAQTSSKVDPLTFVNIPVFVSYPNGTDLRSDLGVVNAAFTNSSGTFTLPMIYNATDHSWRLLFLAPNTGLSFGVTIELSFQARDTFGNAGSAPNAYDLEIGAGTQTLILAAIIAAIVPIALLGWAIFAISGRRRKYKP